MPSSVEYAKRINRTWFVNGWLAETAERYMTYLAENQPDVLEEVCEHAVAAAKTASHEGRDPKPNFYATLFSRATPNEQDIYLKDHIWTRRLIQQ